MVRLEKRRAKTYRYVSDRPPDGYTVTTVEPVVTTAYPTNFIDRQFTVIARIHDDIEDALSRRRRIVERLSDPDLLDAIPSGDRRRLEAEDLVAQIDQSICDLRWDVMQRSCRVGTAGVVLSDDRINEIGRRHSIHDPPIATVIEHVPGILTTATWQRLIAAAVPF